WGAAEDALDLRGLVVGQSELAVHLLAHSFTVDAVVAARIDAVRQSLYATKGFANAAQGQQGKAPAGSHVGRPQSSAGRWARPGPHGAPLPRGARGEPSPARPQGDARIDEEETGGDHREAGRRRP